MPRIEFNDGLSRRSIDRMLNGTRVAFNRWLTVLCGIGATEMIRAASPDYRPDIDDIRGIAILFVLIFHCSSSMLPGGFTGVDVFFVISGYLISSIIFKDILSQRFSIITFYERRIKRIFPALITVLAFTLAIGWVILFSFEYQNLGKHVVGGATFISNILLWRETGYFNAAADSKPLLHLWSLGVEEQFYILFPVSIWFANRVGIATTRFLAALLAFSMAISVYGTLTHPAAAFYLPITRLWELLIGCTLASVEKDHRRIPDADSATTGYFTSSTHLLATRNAVSWLGLSMVVAGAVFITEMRAFPGAWAMLPTLGTAFVISGGKDAYVNKWMFGNKVLVSVGLISYPLYLWHWPLLSFARIAFGESLSNWTTAGLMIVSGLLAWVTYWCIERPIRFGGMPAAMKILRLCACMTVLLIVGLLVMARLVPSRIGMSPLGNQVSVAVQDWNYPFNDNHRRLSDFSKDAEFGRGRSEPATLFIGDSHMQQYWPRIELLLNTPNLNSRPVILITAGGSPALPNVNQVLPGYACDRFFEFAMKEAAQPNVGTVVFGCFWEKYFIGCFPGGAVAHIYRVDDAGKAPLRLGSAAADQVFIDFGQRIATLVGMHKRVLVVLSAPSCQNWNPRRSWNSRLPFLNDSLDANQFRVARKDFEAFVSPIKTKLVDVVTASGGVVIDPLDYFEEGGFFRGRTSTGDFCYRDESHIRPFYVRERAVFLDPMIASDGEGQ